MLLSAKNIAHCNVHMEKNIKLQNRELCRKAFSKDFYFSEVEGVGGDQTI